MSRTQFTGVAIGSSTFTPSDSHDNGSPLVAFANFAQQDDGSPLVPKREQRRRSNQEHRNRPRRTRNDRRWQDEDMTGDE